MSNSNGATGDATNSNGATGDATNSNGATGDAANSNGATGDETAFDKKFKELLAINDYPVIYSLKDKVFKFYLINSSTWISLEEKGKKGKNDLRWCHDTTRGCHLDCGVLVAGSSVHGFCRKVDHLDIRTDHVKHQPSLDYCSNCAGLVWNRSNNSVVLAGGNQHRGKLENPWNETNQMFLLTNVSSEDAKWEELQCKLPHAMEDPLLVMSDSHLYLLGCDPAGKGAKRIPKDSLEPGSEARDWENLEDLEHAIDSNIAKRGAVFILDKVMVFTVEYIMVLDLKATPLSWKYISIIDKRLQCCIPRLFNDHIVLVLMNRTGEDGKTNVLEMYFPESNEWKILISNNKKLSEASLVPWQFFVSHMKFDLS